MKQKIGNSLKLIRDTISFKYIVIYVLTTIFLVLCLFGNLDAKIIESYARYNKEVIAANFLNSTMKSQYIDELNLLNKQSNAKIIDIFFKNNTYVFSLTFDENNPNGEPVAMLPQNDDRIAQMFVEQLMQKTAEWNLCAIFPLVFNIVLCISNKKRFAKLKKKIEIFLLPISIIVSFALFYTEISIFACEWDFVLQMFPILTKSIMLLDFIIPLGAFTKSKLKEQTINKTIN